MAYENLQLVVAGVSGDIYLAKAKDGIMDTNYRRVATNDVLVATTEWFIGNNKKLIQFEADENGRHSLFYTNDQKKADRIIAILKENDDGGQRD